MQSSCTYAVLGTVIRDKRTALGLSQDALAALAGISRASLGEIERGEINPSLSTLMAVARGLKMPLARLIEEYERRLIEAGHHNAGASR